MSDPTTASLQAIAAERDQYRRNYETMSARAEELAADVARLETRQQELLATIVRLTNETPYPDELQGWESQRAAMLAEVGSLRAERDEGARRVAELERDVAARQDALDRCVADKHDLIERMTGAEAALHRFNGVG